VTDAEIIRELRRMGIRREAPLYLRAWEAIELTREQERKAAQKCPWCHKAHKEPTKLCRPCLDKAAASKKSRKASQ
jgi:hypothetical protein